MKVAITNIYGNVIYDQKDPRGLQITFFKKMLEESGCEVELVGKKTKKYYGLKEYIHYEDVDWNNYDCVFLQLSWPIFYGGLPQFQSIDLTKTLASYEGPFYQFVTDPLIKPSNPAHCLWKNFQILKDCIDPWEDIMKRSIYLFHGTDIQKFLKYEPKNWEHLDFTSYIFQNLIKEKTRPLQEKKYDVIYYGDQRKADRMNYISHYMPNTAECLMVGNLKVEKNYPWFKGTVMKKTPQWELMSLVDQSKVCLVIGDREHHDNVKTFRVYEALGSHALAAIQTEFDPHRKIIQDPVLRDLLYVNSASEVLELANHWSLNLIERQRMELKRLFNEAKTKFKFRVPTEKHTDGSPWLWGNDGKPSPASGKKGEKLRMVMEEKGIWKDEYWVI